MNMIDYSICQADVPTDNIMYMSEGDRGRSIASEEEEKAKRRGDSDVERATQSCRWEKGEGEHRCNRFLVSIFHVENWPVHPSGLIYEGRRPKKKP